MGRKYGLDHFTCHALVLLAQVEIALGNYLAAKERLQECDRLCAFQPVSKPTYGAGNDLYWGFIAAASGDTAAAHQHIRAELEMAVQLKRRLFLANALAGIALLYAAENEAAAALESYALAQQHPFVANSGWYEDVVGRHITEIATTLPTEVVEAAQNRGESLDLWETAQKLVVELRENFS